MEHQILLHSQPHPSQTYLLTPTQTGFHSNVSISTVSKMAFFVGGNADSSTGVESDPRSPIGFSAPQQELVYVDVLR